MSALTLSACASSAARPPETDRRDPVIEQRTVVRLFCPAELRGEAPARPEVPDGADVRANDDGARWLSAELGWGGALEALLAGARAACRRAAEEAGS
ncbi:MAG: hypothetical protein KIS81_00705 [Maricaulaceae bacterium]|nr:hypothetical protein [Maricaulaceae bacterium]